MLCEHYSNAFCLCHQKFFLRRNVCAVQLCNVNNLCVCEFPKHLPFSYYKSTITLHYTRKVKSTNTCNCVSNLNAFEFNGNILHIIACWERKRFERSLAMDKIHKFYSRTFRFDQLNVNCESAPEQIENHYCETSKIQ